MKTLEVVGWGKIGFRYFLTNVLRLKKNIIHILVFIIKIISFVMDFQIDFTIITTCYLLHSQETY